MKTLNLTCRNIDNFLDLHFDNFQLITFTNIVSDLIEVQKINNDCYILNDKVNQFEDVYKNFNELKKEIINTIEDDC